MVISLIVKMS